MMRLHVPMLRFVLCFIHVAKSGNLQGSTGGVNIPRAVCLGVSVFLCVCCIVYFCLCVCVFQLLLCLGFDYDIYIYTYIS